MPKLPLYLLDALRAYEADTTLQDSLGSASPSTTTHLFTSLSPFRNFVATFASTTFQSCFGLTFGVDSDSRVLRGVPEAEVQPVERVLNAPDGVGAGYDPRLLDQEDLDRADRSD